MDEIVRAGFRGGGPNAPGAQGMPMLGLTQEPDLPLYSPPGNPNKLGGIGSMPSSSPSSSLVSSDEGHDLINRLLGGAPPQQGNPVPGSMDAREGLFAAVERGDISPDVLEALVQILNEETARRTVMSRGR